MMNVFLFRTAGQRRDSTFDFMETPYQFKRHYTREEARQLLPQVKKWLQSMKLLSQQLEKASGEVEQLMRSGQDCGGAAVEHYLKVQTVLLNILADLERRQILVKDLDRGLVDFPAIIGGREVFLCWEQDEEDIEFWHDLDAGYTGRERL